MDILCGDCQQVYVGKTDRNFACCLKEHRIEHLRTQMTSDLQ